MGMEIEIGTGMEEKLVERLKNIRNRIKDKRKRASKAFAGMKC